MGAGEVSRSKTGSRSEPRQVFAENIPHCDPQPTARYFLGEITQMSVPVRRQILERLKDDRSTDDEAERRPEPTWVSQTKEEAKERVGDNPLVKWIMAKYRAKSNWGQSDKND